MSEKTKAVICGICCFITGVLCTITTYCNLGSELNDTRTELIKTQTELDNATRLNNQLKQQLDATRKSLERERELVEYARTTVNELELTTRTSITGIDDCIKLVRDIRTKVQEMETCFYNRNADHISGLHTDNYNDL